MADSTPSQSSMDRRSSSWPLGLLTLILAPVAAAMLLYQLDPYDPAPVPIHEFSQQPMVVPKLNPRMLQGSEMIGVGKLLSPEDIAYHPDSHLIYTGCDDGWVKRITLNDSMVQNWAFTGGRPLGVALGRHGQLVVADAEKGLLEVTADGMVKTLTDEAEGLKFKLTDGVDVAVDGMIYFTDASYKYGLKEHIRDILEGRPHGRLMSFDPSTKETKVLVRDLFFANGVVVSPDQNSVIVCESVMRRCLKYHIQGERKGSVDKFIDNLPGPPDNILYDGEGHYWIALPMGNSLAWDLALKYPWIRKVVAIMERYKVRPHIEKNGGVLAVDLEGKPTAYYYDPSLSEVTSGVKIGNYLYCGSITKPYMIRLDLHQHAARATM
ncbi:protein STRICTOSIDINE SYNTHASE-LIKE 5 [Vitis vinifera]|uniref:Strictosidine synthase conserved region domain-containing protein n=2 Tax=Vitis vinifera TaxID=29760 RepID=F6I274_VITVI|nr:protein STRICTOSIDINE SYNTHASE-LIKE 5 [Vitis vinifera]|eukprot:XP_002273458.3 PREDICTED: protein STRICTOSIDINE SYNTHASE-LIKE 5 [Vitis vinifera]